MGRWSKPSASDSAQSLAPHTHWPNRDGTLAPSTAMYAAGPWALTAAVKAYEAAARTRGNLPRVTRFAFYRFFPAPLNRRFNDSAGVSNPVSSNVNLSTAAVSCHVDQLCKPLMRSPQYSSWMGTMWGYHHMSGVWWRPGHSESDTQTEEVSE